MKCDYGCGQQAKFQFKNGKWCCSKNHNQCPVLKKKNSGENNPMYCKKRHYSKETRKKMSISAKARPFKKRQPLTEEHKRSISNSMKGKNTGPKTEEHLQKIIDNHPDFSGENNPNWQGGIACDPYCDAWNDKEYKQSIRDRDNNTCLNPDCNGKYNNLKLLDIHHINYNKKDCSPNNLITLCRSCNSRANKDRKWHTAWYSTIIYWRYNNK